MKRETEGGLFSATVRESWDEWLRDFTLNMMPIFEAHGFGRDAALNAYMTNRVLNAIERDSDDDEPWRGST